MKELLEYLGWKADEEERPSSPPPPAPVAATEQLRRNLERCEKAYRDRERVLLEEIQTRENELADVRRAADAALAGLLGLEASDLEPEPAVVNVAVTGGVGSYLGQATGGRGDGPKAVEYVTAPSTVILSSDVLSGLNLDKHGGIVQVQEV